MGFTLNELINGIVNGGEGFLNLPPNDAFTLAQILLKKGYAVLLTGADIGDEIRVEWRYAGVSGNLNYADRRNVAFGERDFVEMLACGDYLTED